MPIMTFLSRPATYNGRKYSHPLLQIYKGGSNTGGHATPQQRAPLSYFPVLTWVTSSEKQHYFHTFSRLAHPNLCTLISSLVKRQQVFFCGLVPITMEQKKFIFEV